MQFVLATDGSTSFAIFIYEGVDPEVFESVEYQVGFDAGNQIDSTVIEPVGIHTIQNGSTQLYRIDGKINFCSQQDLN